MSANARQVGGGHYGGGEYQHWDLVADSGMNYFEGVITKYICRWRKKNGIEDLLKAAHYLEKYIELIEQGRFSIGVLASLRPRRIPAEFAEFGRSLGPLEWTICIRLMTWCTKAHLEEVGKVLDQLSTQARQEAIVPQP